MSHNPAPIDILLVEDNLGDVELCRDALAHARIANRLAVVRDGDEALRFLRRTDEHAEAIRPGLVLLDLNLPGLSGWEVLEEMKRDPVLTVVPVIVLTTSHREADVLRSYALHAAAYVPKPHLQSEFIDAIRAIEGFWLTVVRLPPDR